MTIPAWIMDAITTGFTALVGFFVKYGMDLFNSRNQLNNDRIRKLEDLKGMLEESKNLFIMQNKLVKRLVNEIRTRLNLDENSVSNGYEHFLTENYDAMTEVEKDTHSVIRGTTMNSVNIVNEELQKWITSDKEFKINSVKKLRESEFGETFSDSLSQLELHLNLWRDKYTVWMNNEKHCVVYLDDEERHGVSFPKGIEDLVDEALKKLAKS
jgi:hypothetical protein